MTLIKVLYYLVMLAAMLASIWKAVIVEVHDAADVTSIRLKRSLKWLAAYMAVNFLAEFIVGFCLPPKTYNHFVYATSMMVSAAMLLLFFYAATRRIHLLIFMIVTVAGSMWVYLSRRYWQPQTVLASDVIRGYYSLLAVGSLLFLTALPFTNPSPRKRHLVWMGSVLLAYYTLSLLTVPVNFSSHEFDAYRHYFMMIFQASTYIYYGAMMVIIMRIPDTMLASEPAPFSYRRSMLPNEQ